MKKKINSDPSLKTLLDLNRDNVFETLNCHAIGKIESFDKNTQTAKVSFAYSCFSTEDEITDKDYPLLLDCPVIVLGGGKGNIRFPVSVGDNCLILFNDRDIDNWYLNGATRSVLSSTRKHNLSDGIALVGLYSLKDSLDDYDDERTELIHDKVVISMKDKLRIKNTSVATANLFTILDGVLGILGTLVTTNAVPGQPCAISPAQAAQINLFKSYLGLLMES